MYREAMEHLMAAPPSKTSSTTCGPREETNLEVTSTASCGGEGRPADAGLNEKEASNYAPTTVRNDEAMGDECIVREGGGGLVGRVGGRGMRIFHPVTEAETLA